GIQAIPSGLLLVTGVVRSARWPLAPELGDGREDVAESAVDRESDGEPGQGVAGDEPNRRGVDGEAEQDRTNREALNERFELAGRLGAEGLALALEMAPEPLDQELAHDDRRDHPGVHARLGDREQVDERPGDDHLVDQRVELPSDRSVLAKQSGEVAVE